MPYLRLLAALLFVLSPIVAAGFGLFDASAVPRGLGGPFGPTLNPHP